MACFPHSLGWSTGWRATAVGRGFLPATALVSVATLFTSHGFISRKASPEQARAGSGTEPGDREGESPALLTASEVRVQDQRTRLQQQLAQAWTLAWPPVAIHSDPALGTQRSPQWADPSSPCSLTWTWSIQPQQSMCRGQLSPQGQRAPKGPWGCTGGRWRGGNMVTQEPATGEAGWRLAGGCHWGSQMEVGGTDGQRWAPGQIAKLWWPCRGDLQECSTWHPDSSASPSEALAETPGPRCSDPNRHTSLQPAQGASETPPTLAKVGLRAHRGVHRELPSGLLRLCHLLALPAQHPDPGPGILQVF